MGINIPNIWYMIYLGWPWMLLDYSQESRRAGRDSLASKAIIVHPQGWDDLDPWVDWVSDAEFERVQAYMEVVEGVGCHQYILDQYLDRTVNRYTRQQCQDQDPDKLPYNACQLDGQDKQTPILLLLLSPAALAAECNVNISNQPNNPPNTQNGPVLLNC